MWCSVVLVVAVVAVVRGELTTIGEEDWRQLLEGEWMVEL